MPSLLILLFYLLNCRIYTLNGIFLSNVILLIKIVFKLVLRLIHLRQLILYWRLRLWSKELQFRYLLMNLIFFLIY